MFLDKRYASEDYEIRLKAPVLWAIAVVLAIACVAGAGVTIFLSKSMGSGLVLLLIAVFQIVGMILVGRKRYNTAALLMVSSLAVSIMGNEWVGGYGGPQNMPDLALLNVAVGLVAMTFLKDRRLVLGCLILLVINWVAFASFAGLTGQIIDTPGNPAIPYLVISGMVMLIGMILTIFLHTIFDKILSDAYRQVEMLNKRETQARQISAGVSAQLKETAGLQTVVEETVSGTLHIERNVRSINDEMQRLTRDYATAQSALQSIENRLRILQDHSHDQSSNITQTSTAVEEMVASITSVNQVIESRKILVDKLNNTASESSGILSATVSSFRQVMERIDNVKQMTDFISNVAAQTNLLAMNAAIEAAHAGDAGRGFAVVASEVRKLAESSSSNARQISAILGELVQAIKNSGSNVNRTGEAFNEIQNGIQDVARAMGEIAASVQELSMGSGEILEATGNLNQLTQQVTEGIVMAREETGTVNRSIETVGSILSQTSSGMQQISLGTKEIRDSILSVQELSASLARQAKTLEDSGRLS